MKQIESKIDKIKKYINDITNNNPDYIFKKIKFLKYDMYVIFCESLSNRDIINNYVLEFLEEKNNEKTKAKDILNYFEQNIPTNKITRIKNYEELMYNLYCGFSIIIVDGEKEALSLETRQILNSPISTSKNEPVLKGPNDAFTENYQTNIGLIRKRLKTDKLIINEIIVGDLSKTKISILYINDIASIDIVNYIKEKISSIKIDSIIDTNYITDTINGNVKNVFPTYLPTERPDLVTTNLLEGKIAIVVENSSQVVLLPIIFFELFHNQEDMYQNSANANYTRIIRFLAFLITILTPAVYIAMTTYNQETLPTDLLINFSIQRDAVPLPSILEAILMLLTFEILKETDARIPTIIGSSLSIVGALVLGDAAVTAGVVSPIMVIVIAITSISGLILSYFDAVNSSRWWRMLFLIFAAFAGIIGIFMAGFILLINLSSIKVLGVPYLSPISPLSLKNIDNELFISQKGKFKKRTTFFAHKNVTRGSDNQK